MNWLSADYYDAKFMLQVCQFELLRIVEFI